MNYQALYKKLIDYRLRTPATGYSERHHILPRSMGGSDDPVNLVVLTGREHWVAHLLLYKIYRNSKMAHACHMMAMRCEERGIPQVRNSRMYEEIRKICAKNTGKRSKVLQRGTGNSQYGTRWICNLALKENRKIGTGELIPDGWILGRNKWNTGIKKTPTRQKLERRIVINDGDRTTRYIHYVDQLPIPEGWIVGGLPASQEKRDNLSKLLSNKPRPYRVGLKYKKRNIEECIPL